MSATASALEILDESSILAEAQQVTGLSDFGDPVFREPLRRLLHSLATEAQLSATAAQGQRQRIVGLLVSRLRTEDYYTRYPEIEKEEIESPVVIVGMGRTGTTMLHRALTSDQRLYAVYWWECRYPAPFPETRFGEFEPRIEAAVEEIKTILKHAPKLATIHPWNATGADEELILMEPSFMTTMSEAALHVPSYRIWLEQQDQTPAYQYLKRLLKFLQWQKKRAGQKRERWVLKTPHHLHHISYVYQTFPDASVISTHRDPIHTIPSFISFYATLYELNESYLDKKDLGAWASKKWADSMTRSMDYYDSHPEHAVLNVQYSDTVKDPVGTVERVYQWLGMPLTEEVRQGLQKHLAENTREKREKHVYSAEEYGLTEEGLKQATARYRARFVKDA
jgi:hypothetical protein